mmetsp:Transcript_21932/g.38538  ORF Transcript_21932/g.38538 Transcript_21932/m.38538 type:complete len:208 (+) Transcript_21932:855-1478(+)
MSPSSDSRLSRIARSLFLAALDWFWTSSKKPLAKNSFSMSNTSFFSFSTIEACAATLRTNVSMSRSICSFAFCATSKSSFFVSMAFKRFIFGARRARRSLNSCLMSRLISFSRNSSLAAACALRFCKISSSSFADARFFSSTSSSCFFFMRSGTMTLSLRFFFSFLPEQSHFFPTGSFHLSTPSTFWIFTCNISRPSSVLSWTSGHH